MEFESKQVTLDQIKRPNVKFTGAASSEFCDGVTLAKRAWGEQAEEESSGLTCFAYLYRRFGPPFTGSDDHKHLAAYILTTPDPDVFLEIIPSGSPLCYAPHYWINVAIEEEIYAPTQAWFDKQFEWYKKQYPNATDNDYENWAFSNNKEEKDKCKKEIGRCPRFEIDSENWESGPVAVKRVNESLLIAMEDLLRPVYIRDIAINIFGVTDIELPSVEVSKYAGYGVPYNAMEAWIKD